MNQAWLKKIRVVVSLVFLALTALLFVDFDRIGETPAATAALYPQFVPSLLKFTILVLSTFAISNLFVSAYRYFIRSRISAKRVLQN